jgi:hypothetical protein
MGGRMGGGRGRGQHGTPIGFIAQAKNKICEIASSDAQIVIAEQSAILSQVEQGQRSMARKRPMFSYFGRRVVYFVIFGVCAVVLTSTLLMSGGSVIGDKLLNAVAGMIS